jgi:hypothetical protein
MTTFLRLSVIFLTAGFSVLLILGGGLWLAEENRNLR